MSNVEEMDFDCSDHVIDRIFEILPASLLLLCLYVRVYRLLINQSSDLINAFNTQRYITI